MIIFDGLLLIVVSALLATRSLYLGCVTLVLGLLIAFQAKRVQFLLGEKSTEPKLARKIKAAILSLLTSAAAYPLILETGLAPARDEGNFDYISVLPIVIVIGLFSAAMMAALIVEKRKR